MDMDCKVDFIEKKWLQRKYQLQNYFSSLEPKHTVVRYQVEAFRLLCHDTKQF